MEIMRQTTRVMRWVVLVVVPATALAFGLRVAVGWLVGALWIMANLWIIGQLVAPLASRQARGFWRQVGWWVMKIPVLYGVGAMYLVSPWGAPIAFLMGLSTWFVVVWINALRRATA